MSGTEELIQQTLHLDYETFVNTAFFLQGKADQFAQQKPSDRKRILATILRLDVWEIYKEETLARRRVLENGLLVCRSKIASIDETLAEEDKRNETYNTLARQHALASQLMKSNKELLDKQKRITSQYETEKAQLSKQFLEIKRLRLDLNAKNEELFSRTTERGKYTNIQKQEDEIRKGYKALQDYQRALEDFNVAATLFAKKTSERDTLLAQIASKREILQSNIRSLEAQDAEIKELEQNCNRIYDEIVKLDEKLTLCEEQLKLVTSLNKEIKTLETEQAKIVAKFESLSKEKSELEERKQFLQSSDDSV
jgi:exonuclease SbcC